MGRGRGHLIDTCLCYNLQNLLFYFEAEGGVRPSGVIFLEGCYCERLILKEKHVSSSQVLCQVLQPLHVIHSCVKALDDVIQKTHVGRNFP